MDFEDVHFSINIIICRYLKLEIALAIPALNKCKKQLGKTQATEMEMGYIGGKGVTYGIIKKEQTAQYRTVSRIINILFQ